MGVALGALGGDAVRGQFRGWLDRGGQHSGAGDADQVEVFALELGFTHQPGEGLQVAPLDHDPDPAALGDLFLGLGQVDGQVVDAGRGEDQLGGIVGLADDDRLGRALAAGGGVADDRRDLPFGEDAACLALDGLGDGGVDGCIDG